MHLDIITGAILDEAIAIHRELGPGLLESVYEVVLASAVRPVWASFLAEARRPRRDDNTR